MDLAEANATETPIYVCPICMVGVYLCCIRTNEKRFFFRHKHEDGNCPAVTRGKLSKDEIEARKYNGAKESRAHIRLKEIIVESLSHDNNFSDIRSETVWKGMDRSSWRKPDVQALWKGSIHVAFEIQLSTTFLHVIAERRLFYRQEGGLLCWIFKSFQESDARMTQDDIFYNNNRNILLASEDTLNTSIENGELMLDCRWLEPKAINGEVCDVWHQQLTPFSKLTKDLARQRIFLYDCDGMKEANDQLATDESLKQSFFLWWENYCPQGPIDPMWYEFKTLFKERGVNFPNHPQRIEALLNALYTAREGHTVGWHYSKLISVAHNIAEYHKPVIRVFRTALFVYDRGDQIKAEDREGKWVKKVEAYKSKLRSNDPEYAHQNEYDGMIAFLFPDVWETFKKANK